MRRGEVCGLQWKYVNFEKNLIMVREELIYTKKTGLMLKPPKSFEGTRDIYIPNQLKNILRDEYKRQAQAKLLNNQYGKTFTVKNEQGIPYPSDRNPDFVICHDNGSPHTPDGWSKKFRRLIDKFIVDEKLDNRTTFHQLRHAWATLQMYYGTPVKIISALAGHSTTQITQDTYQHPQDNLARDAAKRIEEGIYKKLKLG
jgi:integrase